MKRIMITLMGIGALVLSFGLLNNASAANGADLARIRAATAKYHQLEAAQNDGFGLVPGLDHCFDNPGVGAMGYHYINTALLDTSLDVNHPEAMIYSRFNDGGLKLSAVEFIVPVKAWTDAGYTGVPQVMGEDLHLNSALGVYVLHAWVWRNNPAGILEDWNPEVSCP
jgi:hypothetical protein